MRFELTAMAARHDMCNYACTNFWHTLVLPLTCPTEGCGVPCGLLASFSVFP